MKNILYEKHHLSGSLKEDRDKLMESMKNFVDTNSLVTRCCWKYFVGELEGEAFLEEFIALKEGVVRMKERYMNLLLYRYNFLMMDKMYHSALKKEEQESERLISKMEITNNSLKST